MKKFLLIVSGALAMASVSSASVILSLVGGTPTAGPGGDYTWTYAVTLSTDQNIRGGGSTDFTEVVDFADLVTASWTSGALNAANVSITQQALGPGGVPPGVTDSPSIMNVVVTNTGAAILGSSLGTGPVGDLGYLVLVSTSGAIAMNGAQFAGAYSSQAQKASDGSTTFNDGYLPTPGVIPEPATMLTVGAGVLGAALLLGRKQKKG